MNKYSHLLNTDPDEFHRLIRKAEWGPIALCLDGDSGSCVMELLKLALNQETIIDRVVDLIYEINSVGGPATTLYIGRKEFGEISHMVKSLCLDEEGDGIIESKVFMGLKVIEVDQESHLKVI